MLDLFNRLIEAYGEQNWWPGEGFEIVIGAVLTQNTSWKNVELAIENMRKANLTKPKEIIKADIRVLKRAIKPAGFFNQKARYLKNIAAYIAENKLERESLLEIKGIGPETADSILLYAYDTSVFVIDVYTKRFLSRVGISKSKDYETLQKLFQENLPEDVELYKEFHALIVEHCKKVCKKQPECGKCVFSGECCHSSLL